MSSCNLPGVMQSLFRDHFSRLFHYCGISLVRFLITNVLNIVSSLHIVFSFCARVGWCDAWTEFTKVDVDADVNEMPPPYIYTRSIACGPYVLSF